MPISQECQKELVVRKQLKSPMGIEPVARLTLPYALRQKSRQRVALDNGMEVYLFLPHGMALRDGSLLEAENGMIIEVKAAAEVLSMVFAETPSLLLRACYHLGNRHVPAQISENHVSYLHDHVLDKMLQGLGLEVLTCEAPFEPEAGAYKAYGQIHS
jgi:urease accessory protein